MQSFSQYAGTQKPDLSELENIAKEIELSYRKHFLHGWIDVRAVISIGEPVIRMYCGLISDKSLLTGGYRDNDPLRLSALISKEKDGKFSIEYLQSSLSLVPEKGSYMAMGSVKIPSRKATVPGDKVASTLDKHFTKVKQVVKDNQAKVYNRSNYPDVYFK